LKYQLAGRCQDDFYYPDFSQEQLSQLSLMQIVPVSDVNRPGKVDDSPTVRWLPPSQCFFGNATRSQFHSKLFVFVDFGVLANSFLSACGTKREPSVEEVAQILLADPRQFYELSNGRDK